MIDHEKSITLSESAALFLFEWFGCSNTVDASIKLGTERFVSIYAAS